MTTLYITKRAWKQIEDAVQSAQHVETGGALMGFQMDNGEWIIAYAGTPGPNAIQHPNAVLFDERHINKVVRKVRTQSAGRLQYIGDWHSHTIRRLTPSRGDRMTIFQKTLKRKYASLSPVMLIAGLNKRGQVQARAFIYEKSLLEVKQIALIDRITREQLSRKLG
ncbi:Mov34/MPN/PAD-1 family protein [Brevibacillus dissolubilis]|uniref:Mov34/MPN/PAD-1 family protein n=1 Tax=Brevibacillus dissolubilis TaxID=1844116 RepID=UPI001117479F|nr:Mov34/MPN/PAD-1 family protein [Brevibacillus dissolubilis]